RPQFETRSMVAAPLRTPQNVLGVICLSDPTHREVFAADDLKLLVTLATQAAIVIDDARHYEELRQRLNEVTVLHELANRLTEVERTDQMVMAVFAAWDHLLVSDRLQWWRWDHADGVLRLDTDTPHSTQDKTEAPVTGALPVAALSEDGICADALRAALTDAQWEFVPGACLTIPVRSSEQPLGVFAVMRSTEHPFDESEQRLAHLVGAQAERIFERQRALLNASRLVTMGKMISEISHDLRKPLTNIRGSLHVLTAGRKTRAEAAEILAATDEEIVRLAALVKELVDFSNPTRYRTERRDMRRILLRAIELIERSARKHRVELAVDIPQTLRPIFCDDNQLTEAFLNILINAIEAMSDGGKLTVTARVEPTHQNGGERVCIAITDTGPGMTERERDRVFERYYTTKSTGTGLGLAIVQRIVNACNGTIIAESAPGVGTTFHLRFPVP
ncbi:MAG TPA: ATP-binding protein, partial [Acidobacteriota bacterium]|nr:ATP-binding protein [Acidobacteriota bacterium]